MTRRSERHRARDYRRYEPGNIFLDTLKGYLFFTQRASCYIVVTCLAIALPVAACAGVGFLIFGR